MSKSSTEKRYIIYTSLLLICVVMPSLPYIKGRLNSVPLLMSAYWCVIIGVIFFILPWLYIPTKGDKYLVGYGFSGGIIFIALQFVTAVMMKKLAASPYDTSLFGIMMNIITIFPQILAREMVRQYSFAGAYKTLRYKRVAIVAITVIFCLIEINFGSLLTTKTVKDLSIYTIQTVAPIITRNILMSVLVFYGGVLPSVVYIGIIQLFEKCFPVLPALSWLIEGSIGIAFPVIYGTFVVDHVFAGSSHEITDRKSDIKYLVSLLLATAFVWFNVGVFPVYPSVILTGSMEPLIMPGDVVLVQKIEKEEQINTLTVGEIISFKRGNITITHRIKKVLKDKAGNISFETKGDNNSAADENKVEPNDVKGIVIKVVPKIGLPALILREQDKIPEGVVDKK